MTKTELDFVREALSNFHRDLGRFPTNGEGFTVFFIAPTGADSSRWRGPYITLNRGFNNEIGRLRADVPRDPDLWGKSYVYETRRSAEGVGYDIFSYGPNGPPFGKGAIIATDDSRALEVK
jgi:general secretion pathway protein G